MAHRAIKFFWIFRTFFFQPLSGYKHPINNIKKLKRTTNIGIMTRNSKSLQNNKTEDQCVYLLTCSKQEYIILHRNTEQTFFSINSWAVLLGQWIFAHTQRLWSTEAQVHLYQGPSTEKNPCVIFWLDSSKCAPHHIYQHTLKHRNPFGSGSTRKTRPIAQQTQ